MSHNEGPAKRWDWTDVKIQVVENCWLCLSGNKNEPIINKKDAGAVDGTLLELLARKRKKETCALL